VSPDYVQQLTRLKKAVSMTITQVFEAVQAAKGGDDAARKRIFSYYYPVALEKAYEFFHEDEEVGNCSAFEFIAKFAGDKPSVTLFNGTAEQLSKFVNTSMENSFIDYYRWNVEKEPDITYGHEMPVDMDDDYSDSDELTHLRRPDHSYQSVEVYPYNGIDDQDPETLLIQQEEQADKDARVAKIREQLYPGDQAVFDLVLEDYNSDEIASILERTTKAVERAMSRIREATQNT